MSIKRQSRTYSRDMTRRSSITPDQYETFGSRKKSFLTNSDKSVLNLNREVGGPAQLHYEKSRRRNSFQPNRSRISTPEYAQNYDDEIPMEMGDISMYHITEAPIEPLPERKSNHYPVAHPPVRVVESPTERKSDHYPFAYPPVSVVEPRPYALHSPSPRFQPVKRNPHVHKVMTATTIRSPPIKMQREKTVNLVVNYDKMRVEHHYADTPNRAQEIIDDLQRRGFIRANVQAVETSYNNEE